MENKAKSKDQTYRNQQEKIRDLEEQLELKSASHTQTEKHLLQLQERLRGREEACSSLQQKVSSCMLYMIVRFKLLIINSYS